MKGVKLDVCRAVGIFRFVLRRLPYTFRLGSGFTFETSIFARFKLGSIIDGALISHNQPRDAMV